MVTNLSVLAASGALLDLDATFFIQLGLFVLVALTLRVLVIRPVLRLIDERRAATEGATARAEAVLAEAERLERELAGRLADARSAGEAERERMIGQARAEERQLMHETREAVARIADETRADLQRRADAVRHELDAHVDDLAKTFVSRVLGRDA